MAKIQHNCDEMCQHNAVGDTSCQYVEHRTCSPYVVVQKRNDRRDTDTIDLMIDHINKRVNGTGTVRQLKQPAAISRHNVD